MVSDSLVNVIRRAPTLAAIPKSISLMQLCASMMMFSGFALG